MHVAKENLTEEEIEEYCRNYDNRPALENLKGKSDLVGVEIGVQYGFNARNILTKYDIRTLYLVDPYDEYYESSKPSLLAIDKETAEKVFKEAKRILQSFEDKIVWIRKYSEEAVDDIPDELDFVYIDGDHRYEFVKRDIELYYPKVKSGGLVAGHDLKSTEPGVLKAVREFFKGEIPFAKNWDWWVIK